GEISFNYKDLSGWNRRDLARNLAVLPQQSVLNFPFTGREVVSLARTPHDTGNQIDTEIVDQVLDYLDANYLADRLYPRLSGGEQQRIQLARVLAQIWDKADQPRLLLLDEPSSYFDLAHQQMLIELVHQLAQRNIAVLIVLHDINMAMACSDRIAVLSCGRLKAFGKTDEVITPELLKSVFSVEARFVIDPETGERFMTMPGSSRRSLAAGETE
ncbi:MAG: ATP-binding cassette domain-containing protein, partial [Porticoccaceae bacterium]|nr:ATP-binding cassette domain-containing protein [Porticoccaceae bacterium]